MPERYSPRRAGDRRDGRRLRTVSPVFLMTPFVMRSPSDALHTFTDQADTAAMEAWLRDRRAEGRDDISMVHVFIAAYVRMLSHRPAMNRFVTGRFIYVRDRIDVVLSSGRSGQADAGALAVKVHFLPTDTIYDVVRKMNSQLDSIKADQEADRLERLASTLVKTPRFLLRFGTAVLRWLDYHAWLGDRWLELSPFHGTVVISDEGASSLPPMTRSLNSMGSLPVSLSIGRRGTVRELTRTGGIAEKKLVDYTVSVDARIADSAYIGAAFKYFRYYLNNPADLEKMPERVNEDAL